MTEELREAQRRRSAALQEWLDQNTDLLSPNGDDPEILQEEGPYFITGAILVVRFRSPSDEIERLNIMAAPFSLGASEALGLAVRAQDFL
jgi:hypothetical protein